MLDNQPTDRTAEVGVDLAVVAVLEAQDLGAEGIVDRNPATVPVSMRGDEAMQRPRHGHHERQRYARRPAIRLVRGVGPHGESLFREALLVLSEEPGVLLGKAPFLEFPVLVCDLIQEFLAARVVAQHLAELVRDQRVAQTQDAVLITIRRVEARRLLERGISDRVRPLLQQILAILQFLLGQCIVFLAGIGIVVLAGVVPDLLLLPFRGVVGEGLNLVVVEVGERDAPVGVGIRHRELDSRLPRRSRREREGDLDASQPVPRNRLVEVEVVAAVDHRGHVHRRSVERQVGMPGAVPSDQRSVVVVLPRPQPVRNR